MRNLAAALAALFLLVASRPGLASTLSVTPIRLVLSQSAPLGSFTVVNEGPTPARVQLSLNVWTQPKGDEVLTPTREVLVNPTIFEIAGNSRQIVRLGLQAKAPAPAERAYRLIVQEVPSAAQLRSQAVGVLLRFSVPLFVPIEGGAPKLAWTMTGAGRDSTLLVTNSGNAHAQLTNLTLTRGTAKLFDGRLSVYVLPGATVKVPVKLLANAAPGDAIKLDAKTDNGDAHADVRVDRP